jgi:drug/metabolite transporter (DMT)-like permease
MRNRNILYVALVSTTLVWGGVVVAIKEALLYLSPAELALMRYGPAALVFGALLCLFQRQATRELLRSEWRRLAVMGLCGVFVNPLAINTGESLIPASTASLIIFFNPLFVFVLSALFLHERVTWRRLLGLGLAFVGAFVVVRFGAGYSIGLRYLRGVLVTVCGTLAWAVYTVLGRPVAERYPPLAVTGVATMLGTIPLLLIARPALVGKLAAMPWQGWAGLAYLALLGTVVGFTIWSAALSQMEATNVGAFFYLVPLWGVALSWLLLGDPITPATVLGTAIVLSGLVLVNHQPRGAARPRAALPVAEDSPTRAGRVRRQS